MFLMCEAMKWNHLPVPGGLYAQDPELLEGFMYIFRTRSAYEEEKEAREKSQRDSETRAAKNKARR